MFSFNREKIALNVAPVLVWTWVAFTSIFTLLSFAYPFIQASQIESARQTGYVQGTNDTRQAALQSFSGNIFQNGQNAGQQLVVSQLVQELARQFEGGCKDPISVPVGTGSIAILSAACHQQLVSTGTVAAE